MTVQRKSFPVEFKTDGLGKGQVEALVSIFGNVDLGGDRVMKGAFAGSIAKWKSSGNPVPVVFSHKWDDPWAHIGVVDDLEETEQGLKANYTLDVDDNPLAAHIHRLMKRGSLKEHSFAYSITKEKRGEDGATELHDLELIEVGPTLKGMNPDTELLAVKSAMEQAADTKFDPSVVAQEFDPPETKSGLTSNDVAALRKALDTLTNVLSTLTVEPKEKSDEADDVKTTVEDEPASDTALLSLQRQINALKE